MDQRNNELLTRILSYDKIWNINCIYVIESQLCTPYMMRAKRQRLELTMKKQDYITAINEAIEANDLDFDNATSEMSVKDLKDLHSDVADATAASQAPPTVTVAQLATEAGKDPKAVRQRLRTMYRKDEKNELPQPLEGANQRWTYAEEHRDALMALITNES